MGGPTECLRFQREKIFINKNIAVVYTLCGIPTSGELPRGGKKLKSARISMDKRLGENQTRNTSCFSIRMQG